jgi:hypothetical protein
MRGMWHIHVALAFILIITISPCLSAEQIPPKEESKHLQAVQLTHNPKVLKVLFIGNRYTRGIRDTLSDLVEASPRFQSTLEYVVKGGWTLKQHLNDSNTIARIKSTKWDYVVLQEQSLAPTLPGRYDDFCDAMVTLSKMIRQCGAKPVLYMTWGRRDKDRQNPLINPDYETMQMRLSRAYTDVANKADALIVPVGEAWRAVRRERPQLGIQLYRDDVSHPSKKGAYLAACVFYATLFDADPTDLNFNSVLPAKEAAYLKDKAKKAIKIKPKAVYDVAVTNIALPSNCNQGDTLPVTVSLANQGTRRSVVKPTDNIFSDFAGKWLISFQELTDLLEIPAVRVMAHSPATGNEKHNSYIGVFYNAKRNNMPYRYGQNRFHIHAIHIREPGRIISIASRYTPLDCTQSTFSFYCSGDISGRH